MDNLSVLKYSKEVMHISHKDLDGESCTLLTEAILEAYPVGMFHLGVKHILPPELYSVVVEILKNIDNYTMVIITDLAISQAVADLIDNSGHREKFRYFDHHRTDVDTSKYPWLYVVTSINTKPATSEGNQFQVCATWIYYGFLKNDQVFNLNLLGMKDLHNISHFVSVVNSYDTYAFSRLPAGEMDLVAADAPRLNTLFHVLPREEFYAYIKTYIMGNAIPMFSLTTSSEEFPWIAKTIDLETYRNSQYVAGAQKKKQIFDLLIDNVFYKVALVFAERNGPMIGTAINTENPLVDFTMVVTNNQCSIYTIKDYIDCYAIASRFGGGGHQKAAGFGMTYTSSNRLYKTLALEMLTQLGGKAINPGKK